MHEAGAHVISVALLAEEGEAAAHGMCGERDQQQPREVPCKVADTMRVAQTCVVLHKSGA